MKQTLFHDYYTAKILEGLSDEDRFVPIYASSNSKVYPFQIAAANFALRSPYQKDAVLCDEAGLGKSHEAMLVIVQKWLEGQRRILFAVPNADLLFQWAELIDEFYSTPYVIIASGSDWDALTTSDEPNPFLQDAIVITTNEFVSSNEDAAKVIPWDLTVFEEANVLSAVYQEGNQQAKALKRIAEGSFMRSVQKRNLLPLTESAASRQFCVEMETGIGKTYVYTKTIFELNRRYGFTKFIVVVPSVAIRESVYKSFQLTEEHFALQYDGVPCRYFIYSSAKLSDVRQFATSANIEVMIINIDAFKKAENVINQAQDRLNGETAMRYIQDTNPIVIIDEPQSVDNTPKAKEAIASLNPLCVLRYSATHREKINLLYRLAPVDAYQMGLVKQIAVSSNQIYAGFDQAYVRLLSVSNDKGFAQKLKST